MTADADRAREAHAAYFRIVKAMAAAAAEIVASKDAFRRNNSAPTGKYWSERDGEMTLRDLPAKCSDFECDEPAVAWTADGRGMCEEHEGDR